MSGLGGGLGQTMNMSGSGSSSNSSSNTNVDVPISYRDTLAVGDYHVNGYALEAQTVTVTDIISEGPIQGLVRGVEGVHLNDANLINAQAFGGIGYQDSTVMRIVNGSKYASIVGETNMKSFPYDYNYGGSMFIDPIEAPDRVLTILTPLGSDTMQVKSVISAVAEDDGIFNGNYEWGLEAPDNSSNWWDDDWIQTEALSVDPEKGLDGLSPQNYKSVTLKNTATGESLDGHLVTIGSSHPVSGIQSKRLIFRPGSFYINTFDLDVDKYSSFVNNSSDYELIINRTVIVNEFGLATGTRAEDQVGTWIEDQGFIIENFKPLWENPYIQDFREQKVALSKTWNYNEFHNFTYTSPTNSSLTVPSSSTFQTGDEVIYTNSTSGGDYGGLEAFDPTISNVGNGRSLVGIYYIVRESSTKIKLAKSRANAMRDNPITVTFSDGSYGSGGHHRLERGSYDFLDHGFITPGTDDPLNISHSAVYHDPDVQVQFRSGHLQQQPFQGPMGTGATAITNELNEEINNTTGYGGDQSPIVLQGTASTGFNLSSSNVAHADEVRIRFNYPGGFKSVTSSGEDARNFASYKLTIQTRGINDSSFGPVRQTITVDQTGTTSNATVVEKRVMLGDLKPFADFKITIYRLTSTDKPGYTGRDGFGVFKRLADSQNVSRAQISSVTTTFHERLIYPLTAMARVSFSSKAYGDVPKRSYHCKGMIVKVPSNYITRDESRSGVASYTRKGLFDSGVAVDWDGTFREAYTNNPAWIFYDIVTNNRYGLGDFVKETDIDKYSLYRIGKYCDELVPNGLGGMEPRYTLNTYLTKSTDAYKVLKDLATNFLSMVYYLNGKVFLVQDGPDAPTHNFSKANVIDGAFQYETTGSKTRANQIEVIWNNPANNFKPEPLIVEDRRNISETGQLVSKEATAFGCTSEGQATRYGKWKLWTAVNQNEIVSFKTSAEGAFIAPGEVILVQDSDRLSKRFSGRISGKLTDSLTLSATYPAGAISQSADEFDSPQSGQPVVLSGEAVLPSTFSTSGEVLFEVSSTDGTFLGMVEKDGQKQLIFRTGNGTAGTEESAYNRIVKYIPISDIPEFDDRKHTITLEIHPTGAVGSKGTARVWIDRRLVINESTTSSALQNNRWSSGSSGGWGQRGGTVAGYSASTTPAYTDLDAWSGDVGSLRVYNNQVVSSFPTTTTVTLDAPVAIQSNFTYDLSIIFSKSSAVLRSSSASYDVEAVMDTNAASSTATFDNENDPIRRYVKVGMGVTGSSIPDNTTVTAISGSTLTLSNAPTFNSGNATLTFSGGTHSQGDQITHAYIESGGARVFQAIDTQEKASNSTGTANSADFLSLSFSDNSRVETRSVSTGAGYFDSLTVSEDFSEIPQADSIWVLTETDSDDITTQGSGKKYKVLSISQEEDEQYSITAAEYYDEKYAAVEEEFSLFVQKDAEAPASRLDEVPRPTEAWAQIIQSPIAKDSDTVIVNWVYAQDEGTEVTQSDGTKTREKLFNHYRGGATVEVRHSFPNMPSPVVVSGTVSGRPQIVFPEVQEGTYYVELRTMADRGQKSRPIALKIDVAEKLKRREAGFFPEALHGGASSTKGTEIV